MKTVIALYVLAASVAVLALHVKEPLVWRFLAVFLTAFAVFGHFCERSEEIDDYHG